MAPAYSPGPTPSTPLTRASARTSAADGDSPAARGPGVLVRTPRAPRQVARPPVAHDLPNHGPQGRRTPCFPLAAHVGPPPPPRPRASGAGEGEEKRAGVSTPQMALPPPTTPGPPPQHAGEARRLRRLPPPGCLLLHPGPRMREKGPGSVGPGGLRDDPTGREDREQRGGSPSGGDSTPATTTSSFGLLGGSLHSRRFCPGLTWQWKGFVS